MGEPASNGSPITGYRILYQEGGMGGFFEKVKDTKSTDLGWQIIGLKTGGVSYQFEVQALNKVGQGPSSPQSDPCITAYSEATADKIAVAKAHATFKANHKLFEARQLRAKWLLTKERLQDMTSRFRVANEVGQKA